MDQRSQREGSAGLSTEQDSDGTSAGDDEQRSYTEAEKNRHFQRFYRDHYEMGFRYLRALRFPYNSLRDVLSHCFELAWNRFDEYLAAGKPPYWFFGILKNKAGYERRKYSKNGELLTLADEEWKIPGDDRPSPEKQLLDKERHSFFYRTITKLPPKYGDVVKLRLSGYDYRFISSTLGISVTNAQTRMRRAVVMLEKDFTDYLEVYGMDA